MKPFDPFDQAPGGPARPIPPPPAPPDWQPFDLLAQVLLRLTYGEMLDLGKDLHSDLEGASSLDFAMALHRWAQRQRNTEGRLR
jgi:predicted deacylase